MANVLIVDDDFELAQASREFLELAGHRIHIAHNGKEGLASLSATPLPDCVVLDLDMPVLDGQRMAHQMLLHDAGEEEVPILLTSGRDDLPAVAARMGTPYFIAKASPGYCELLLKLLERALIERCPPRSA